MWSNYTSTEQISRSFVEEARRAQIVGYAIEAIAELGYAKASLAEIAKRARISKGVISYHFAGKDDLMRQVAVEGFSAGEEFVKPRAEAEATARAKLRTFIESSVEFISTHREHMVALLEILTTARSEDGRSFLEATTLEPRLSGLERILRTGQEEGEFRWFDTRIMAVTIAQAIDGLTPQLSANPNLELEPYARELTTTFDLATRRADS